MLELTPQQLEVLGHLRDAQFAFRSFPLYASYVAVVRGNCAALLAPVPEGGMRIYGEPCYLVAGNMAVRTKRDGRDWFVWKQRQVEATASRLEELRQFVDNVRAILGD